MQTRPPSAVRRAARGQREPRRGRGNPEVGTPRGIHCARPGLPSGDQDGDVGDGGKVPRDRAVHRIASRILVLRAKCGGAADVSFPAALPPLRSAHLAVLRGPSGSFGVLRGPPGSLARLRQPCLEPAAKCKLQSRTARRRALFLFSDLYLNRANAPVHAPARRQQAASKGDNPAHGRLHPDESHMAAVSRVPSRTPWR